MSLDDLALNSAMQKMDGYSVNSYVDTTRSGAHSLHLTVMEKSSGRGTVNYVVRMSEEELRELMWRIEAAIERRDWKNPYLRDDERYLPE